MHRLGHILMVLASIQVHTVTDENHSIWPENGVKYAIRHGIGNSNHGVDHFE